MVGAFSCVLLVHITGKRPLVFVSLIGTGICFSGAATYAWYLDSVPGFIVDNVVANYSIPDHLQRMNFINQKNITVDAMMSDASDIETKMELMSSTTAKAYFISENKTTLSSIPNTKENKYLWLPLALLLTGSFFAHLGIRIIPWMLIGEVFPVNVRSAASGLSSGIGYIFAFLSNKVFLQMIATLTLPGTFWFYSAVAVIGCLIFYFVLPETENRKLIDIEAYFLGKKFTKDITANNNNVLPQMNDPNHQDNEAANKTGECEPNGSSVPEVMVSQERLPDVGSKRYKNRVSDTIRSRNLLTSNVDVQDTRL